MIVHSLELGGAFLIETAPFRDKRGVFARVYCEEELRALVGGKPIRQINISHTRAAGTVRGMHFQHPPHAEAKIVYCVRGAVFDVVVDLRRASSTFLRWHGETLDADEMKMMFVPEGFAHGFQALVDGTELLYLHYQFYHPESEGGLRPDDPILGIEWPLPLGDMSARDCEHPFVDGAFQGLML